MTRDLALVAASLFFWGFGEGMFFYFIPLSLQNLGANPLMIGGVYGGIGLAAALMQIPAGILTDRIGPRTIMWISWGIGALACWILASAQTLTVFVIGIWLYYMTSFGVVPLNSYVTGVRGKFSPQRALYHHRWLIQYRHDHSVQSWGDSSVRILGCKGSIPSRR